MECVLVSCARLAAPTPSDEVLARALEARGIATRHAAWDAIDPAETRGQLVCLRSTWDYHLRTTEFLAWVEACAQAGAHLPQPPELVRWNANKGYLQGLAAAGIAMPDSAWFPPGVRPDLATLMAERGWYEAVLKPRTSATARCTYRLAAGDTLSDAAWAPVMESGALVQEFLPEVTAGELSLMYAGHTFTHAVRKVPAVGEYRVQSEFGGRVELVDPAPATRALAEAVLAATPVSTTYARVDLVETARGPLLMELELIEPELFLDLAPAAADCLADALLAPFSHRTLVP